MYECICLQSVTGGNPHKHQDVAVSIDMRNGGEPLKAKTNDAQLWVTIFHVACMMLGWVVLLPLGILMAKIKHVVGKRWFNLHRIFQVGHRGACACACLCLCL